jgi:hypothetical protein
MKVTIGIDPGKSGAVAIISIGSVYAVPFGDDSIALTIKEAVELYDIQDDNVFCYIESVHAFPGQGVSSAFAFGRAFGEALGALDSLGVPYKLVSPQAWQKTLPDMPKKKDGAAEHKRALKQEAQRRFPSAKPTLKTCDALLIAEYGARDRI